MEGVVGGAKPTSGSGRAALREQAGDQEGGEALLRRAANAGAAPIFHERGLGALPVPGLLPPLSQLLQSARPCLGKTTLAIDMLRTTAIQHGLPAAL